MKMQRRDWIVGAGLAAAGGYSALRTPDRPPSRPATKSPVVVLKASSYEADLVDLIGRGVKECGLDVRGKSVLLKPNLVEFDSQTVINTDARFIAAVVEVFRNAGASSVRIGEGPGHRRDTLALANEAGYDRVIPDFQKLFTDLNRDDVHAVRDCFPEIDFFFPVSVLQADLIVSLAKMKTHHWAGATLSMKNFFGVVPGSVYGWPKNQLHYFGIEDSILGLNRYFASKAFGIVDGIVAMEGNGPIQGTPIRAETVVLGKDLVAVDSTCCRIMGLNPGKVGYLSNAFWGNVEENRIIQQGEDPKSLVKSFQIIPAFRHLQSS